jgi:Holliday junction resolvase
MGKGYKAENSLFNKLWDMGYGVIRSAGSGCRKHPQPDLLVSNGEGLTALELKRTRELPIYIPKQEVFDLVDFCNRFGATPLIGVREDREEWRFHRPMQCKRTEKSYKINDDTGSVPFLDGGENGEN